MSYTPLGLERALRNYGSGWMLAWILFDPDVGIAHAKSSAYGCSSYAGTEHWMETTAKGITIRDLGNRDPLEVIAWTEIKRFALKVPADVRDQLRAVNRALSVHQAAYPTWKATGIALGCGRRPEIGPLTPGQAAYDEQSERWDREQYRPWAAEKRHLHTWENQLLDQAFAAPEPTDLLELLAVMA